MCLMPTSRRAPKSRSLTSLVSFSTALAEAPPKVEVEVEEALTPENAGEPAGVETVELLPGQARWAGVIGYENQPTGDGRVIAEGALRWPEDLAENPIPIRYVASDVGAHDGAQVVGLIDTIERMAAEEDGSVPIWGEGIFDDDQTAVVAQEAYRHVDKKMTNGVSMDLDDVVFEVEQGESGSETMRTNDARIRAVTIVAIPAFAGARISIVGAEEAAEPAVEADVTTLQAEPEENPAIIVSTNSARGMRAQAITKAKLRKLAGRPGVTFAYQTTKVKSPEGEWVETPAAAIDIAANSVAPDDPFEQGLALLNEADMLELGSEEYLTKVREAVPLWEAASEAGGDRSGDASKVLEILNSYLEVKWPSEAEAEEKKAAPAAAAEDGAEDVEVEAPAESAPTTQKAAAETKTFAFNPDQWRNPANGQWIDMPGRILDRILAHDDWTSVQRNKIKKAQDSSDSFIDNLNGGNVPEAVQDLENIKNDLRGVDTSTSERPAEADEVLNSGIDKIDELKTVDWFKAPLDDEGIGDFDEPEAVEAGPADAAEYAEMLDFVNTIQDSRLNDDAIAIKNELIEALQDNDPRARELAGDLARNVSVFYGGVIDRLQGFSGTNDVDTDSPILLPGDEQGSPEIVPADAAEVQRAFDSLIDSGSMAENASVGRMARELEDKGFDEDVISAALDRAVAQQAEWNDTDEPEPVWDDATGQYINPETDRPVDRNGNPNLDDPDQGELETPVNLDGTDEELEARIEELNKRQIDASGPEWDRLQDEIDTILSELMMRDNDEDYRASRLERLAAVAVPEPGAARRWAKEFNVPDVQVEEMLQVLATVKEGTPEWDELSSLSQGFVKMARAGVEPKDALSIYLRSLEEMGRGSVEGTFGARKGQVFNWVDEVGGLPKYIREIADSLIKRGQGESRAIATAVNTVKRWAKGGPARAGGKGSVSAKTQAKAAAALAAWEAKKARAKATSAQTMTASVGAVAERRRELLAKVKGEQVVEEAEALVAAAAGNAISRPAVRGRQGGNGIPVAPPSEWFSNPHLKDVSPLTIDDDGRIYGHLASWQVCHAGSPAGEGVCIMAPKNHSGYAYFHTGAVKTAEGQTVATGRLVMNGQHADTKLGFVASNAHYDNSTLAVADVRVGEDRHGIWVAGALRPDVTAKQLRTFRASPISGDWRMIGGKLELTVGLSVNAPGFPVPRVNGLVASVGGDSEAADHELVSLVAAGMIAPKKVLPPSDPDAFSVEELKYLRTLARREKEAEALARQEKVHEAAAKLAAARNKEKVAAFVASRQKGSEV